VQADIEELCTDLKNHNVNDVHNLCSRIATSTGDLKTKLQARTLSLSPAACISGQIY
jgi:hypothetical protein